MITAVVQFVEPNGNPVGGLPVANFYCWGNNYLGYGAGCSSTIITTTDTNGEISRSFGNIGPSSSADTFSVKAPTMKVTTYSTTLQGVYQEITTYRGGSATYNLGNNENNNTITNTFKVGVSTTKKLIQKNTTVITTTSTTPIYVTTTANTTVSNGVSNFFSGLGASMQTNFEIIAVLGALVAVAAILIFVIKLRSGGGK